MLSLVVNSRLHHRQPTHFRRCPAFLPSSLHLIATSLLPCFLASSSSNSFPCHTSKNPSLTLFFATLPKTQSLKPCVCHTSEKQGGPPGRCFAHLSCLPRAEPRCKMPLSSTGFSLCPRQPRQDDGDWRRASGRQELNRFVRTTHALDRSAKGAPPAAEGHASRALSPGRGLIE